MLLPSKLAAMKLGIRREWRAQPAATNLGATANPPAYSRIIPTPRVEGDNSQIGDCFPTACANAVQTRLAAFGSQTVVPSVDAITAYTGMAGYNPADPATDQGTDPDAGFQWWKANAIAGYRLGNLLQINPQSEGDIRHFISRTGGVLLCVELAAEQQNQRVWTATGTAGSWGGHAIWADSYEGALTKITSWGEEFYIDRSYFGASGFVVGAYALELVAA